MRRRSRLIIGRDTTDRSKMFNVQNSAAFGTGGFRTDRALCAAYYLTIDASSLSLLRAPIRVNSIQLYLYCAKFISLDKNDLERDAKIIVSYRFYPEGANNTR